MRNLILLALCLNPALAMAGASSFGETAGIEASVRANGMGDAYTAGPGDLYGHFYNPALAAETRGAGLMFQQGYSEDATSALALSLPRLKWGWSLGASLLYYDAGNMDLYTNGGQLLTVKSQQDYAGALNLARKFGLFTAGANVKYFKTTLFETAEDSTLLYDAGLVADLPLLRVGVAAQNLGGELKLGSEAERVLPTWRAGLSRQLALTNLDITANFDAVKRERQPEYYRLGAEFLYKKKLALRAGYEFKNTLSEANSIRFGLGWVFDRITADYALVPYQDLGMTHRISVAYRFGSAQEQAQRPEPQAAQPPQPVEVPAVSTAPVQPIAPIVTLDEAGTLIAAADASLDNGDLTAAKAGYNKAYDLLPATDERRVRVSVQLGDIALKGKETRKAKQFYLQAIEIAKLNKNGDKAMADAYYGLAYCLEQEGRLQSAVKNYKKAAQLGTAKMAQADILSHAAELQQKLAQSAAQPAGQTPATDRGSGAGSGTNNGDKEPDAQEPANQPVAYYGRWRS